MNETVLAAIEEHALTPEAVEQVLRLTERDDQQEQQDRLERERKDVEKKIKRLLEAIEAGGDATSLVNRLRELEARKEELRREILNLRPVPRLPAAVVEDRLGEWRRLLRLSTTQGRAVIQRVLVGRLTFKPRPDGQGYDFSGPMRFDRLFTGVVAERPTYVKAGDMRGTEHIRSEDTLDLDYGRLLEARLWKRGGDPGGI